MQKLTEERKIHITNVFTKEVEPIIGGIISQLDKLDRKFGCIEREKIVNYIKKRMK